MLLFVYYKFMEEEKDEQVFWIQSRDLAANCGKPLCVRKFSMPISDFVDDARFAEETAHLRIVDPDKSRRYFTVEKPDKPDVEIFEIAEGVRRSTGFVVDLLPNTDTLTVKPK